MSTYAEAFNNVVVAVEATPMQNPTQNQEVKRSRSCAIELLRLMRAPRKRSSRRRRKLKRPIIINSEDEDGANYT